MSLVSFTQIQDGTTAQASQVNGPLNTLYNEFNGNITSVNLADDAVTTNKVADGAVTPDKRSGGFKHIAHVFGTGTGTQTITGVGFKPGAIIVDGPLQSTPSASWLSTGKAAFDGVEISQSTRGIFAQHSASRTRGYTSTAAAFYIVNESGAVAFEARVTSFDDDGITVNVTTGSSTASDRTYYILFLG